MTKIIFDEEMMKSKLSFFWHMKQNFRGIDLHTFSNELNRTEFELHRINFLCSFECQSYYQLMYYIVKYPLTLLFILNLVFPQVDFSLSESINSDNTTRRRDFSASIFNL